MEPSVLPAGGRAMPPIGAPPPIGALPARVDDVAADPGVEAVAHALRGARARTGMSERQVVAKLAEDGFAITVTRLRGWERTGVIRVDAAARLADAYGMTIDSLAGRRTFRTLPQRR